MKVIKNILLFTVLAIIAISCENDFAPLGSDIVGGDNFTASSETFPVITFNQAISAVQTNGLPNYLLGHFNDATYGGSSANIVSQMSPTQFDPEFEENIRLDSVVLTIPYFSTPLSVDEEGNIIYDVDSIFGNSPIRLSVFQNNFFLRDFDPNLEFGEDQRYFSNGSTSATDFIPQEQLENLLLYDSLFVPNVNQINLTTTTVMDNGSQETVISERLAPALRVKLDNPIGFWENLIFEREGEIELSNMNNFNNHFRGIYIRAEPVNDDGSMVLFNLASPSSNITLFFSSSILSGDPNSINDRLQDNFVLNFSGNTVNIFDDNFISIPDGDEQNGDERLFLKGGEGSMAIINLFNGDENGDSPEFENFKNDFIEDGVLKRIVNEAFLEFTVDQTMVQGEEPDRVYIYDLNNNIPLIDFFLDQSSTVDSPEARNSHLRPLVRIDNDPNGEGQNYRVRITEHINNLILRDSTNVKLGLVVTSNPDSPSSVNLPFQNNTQTPDVLPIGTILSPRGTVLFGNNTTDDRRVQFRIFFTEPNN